jgi:hypothetical protein
LNVSSITDNGVGDYTLNFTTALPDVNYAVTLAGFRGVGGAGSVTTGKSNIAYSSAVTASNVRVMHTDTVATAVDPEAYSVAIFR